MVRKGIAFIAVAIALVSFVAACGGASAPTATPAKGGATPATQATSAPAPGGGGATASGDFHGIPLPAGAQQAQSMAWQVLGGPEEGDYGKMEWRGYKANLKADQLISFYKGEMPKRGWTQAFWMEGSGEEGGMAWGIYSRDNEAQMAWVYVVQGEEDFNLVLMWAGEKK